MDYQSILNNAVDVKSILTPIFQKAIQLGSKSDLTFEDLDELENLEIDVTVLNQFSEIGHRELTRFNQYYRSTKSIPIATDDYI